MPSIETIGTQVRAADSPAGRGLHVLRRARVYLELTKARLTGLVLVTTAAGFLLAGSRDWAVLAWALLGTAMAGGGANGLNQWYEAAADARMPRTRRRPVAAARIASSEALAVSGGLAIGGIAVLAAGANGLTAALGAAAVLLYVLAYTPLKQRSSTCTLIGSVVGALPPVMGYTAATGQATLEGWMLGAILFVWQVPHSLALAWLYRDDYDKGGFRILTHRDADGRRTFRMIMLYSLCLLAVSLAPVLVGRAGGLYALGAMLLGAWLLVPAVQLWRTGQDGQARRLFVASVIYLPLLLGLLLVDRLL